MRAWLFRLFCMIGIHLPIEVWGPDVVGEFYGWLDAEDLDSRVVSAVGGDEQDMLFDEFCEMVGNDEWRKKW